MPIDRLGDHRGLGSGGRTVIGRRRVRAQCRPREADPELRTPQPPFLGALVVAGVGRRTVFLQQLEALVSYGVQPDVIPGAELLR